MRSRKSAVASALVSPSYNGMVGVVYDVFYVEAFRPAVLRYHCLRHMMSAYRDILDLSLYWC